MSGATPRDVARLPIRRPGAFNGPDMMNDALLSGSIDLVSGAPSALITLWAKTRGTRQAVAGVSALSTQPFLLNTRNPAIKSLADFTPRDRIAVPAIKASNQAVLLQMAAAKPFGQADYARLDPLTVALSPIDATIALTSPTDEVDAAFSPTPFCYEQLKSPGVHLVLNSFDIMGPHTMTMLWTSARFHDDNPRLYRAIMAALTEASALINQDRPAAASYWIADTNSKMSLEDLTDIISRPQVEWTLAPKAVMAYAEFMHAVGAIKVKPSGWRELFFPEIHDADGS